MNKESYELLAILPYLAPLTPNAMDVDNYLISSYRLCSSGLYQFVKRLDCLTYVLAIVYLN